MLVEGGKARKAGRLRSRRPTAGMFVTFTTSVRCGLRACGQSRGFCYSCCITATQPKRFGKNHHHISFTKFFRDRIKRRRATKCTNSRFVRFGDAGCKAAGVGCTKKASLHGRNTKHQPLHVLSGGKLLFVDGMRSQNASSSTDC